MNKKKIISLGVASAVLLSTGFSYGSITNHNTAYATESAPSLKDYKSLPDGEYDLTFLTKHANATGQLSMADGAMVKPAKLLVNKGEYKVKIKFQPINVLGQKGYLGDLFYYDKSSKKIPAKTLEFYSAGEKDAAFEVYKKTYPDREAYPKEFEFPIDKDSITSDGKLISRIGVYVPMMASIREEIGYQDALVEFNFSNIALNNKKEANKESSTASSEGHETTETANNESTKTEKLVALKITDETSVKTNVRRAMEKIAKVRENNGKKELVLTYYSKQNWGENYIYDDGLMNVWYNYDGSQNRTKLESKVVETGDHYEISEVVVPMDGDKPIYIFGKTQLNAYTKTTQITYGIINVTGDTPQASGKNNTPKLLRVSQFGASEKDSSEKKLPFDYEKNGKLFSPYTAEKGTKFKQANGKFSVDLQFERTDIQNTDIRYIKYTLDGSEPTNNSLNADFRSQTSDPSLPSSLYRILINPLEDIKGFSKDGGDVTIKVKGFDIKGQAVSETQTFTLPFSKRYIDEVPFKLDINNKDFSAKLSSNGNYVLTDDVNVQTENANYVKTELKDKIKELGLEDVSAVKISLVKGGASYTPEYFKGWLEDKNPLLKVDVSGYSSNNKQVYLYNTENGSLNLVATSATKTKISFSLNQPEGIYILATTDTKKLLNSEKEKLTKQVADAKKILEKAKSSKEKIRLNQEIGNAEKILSKNYTKLDAIIKASENITKALEDIENANFDTNFLKTKVEANNSILAQPILKELLTETQYNKLMSLKSEINSNLDNHEKLQSLLENLDKELSTLEYKHKTQDIDYMVEKYYNPGVDSMASGVFDNKNARLIYTPDKTYLEVNLKTMVFWGIRAHLTNLDIFKDKLDGEKLNVYSLAKFEDTVLSGKPTLFDKKLIIELEKNAKQKYAVRLGNDGMGGMKPEARLVIKSKIENNTPEEKEVTLTDSTNNISVSGKKIPKNSKLVTKKLDKKIEKLSNKEYDLYDIEIQNKDDNSKVNVLGQIEITIPKKQDKNVEKVYYVADNGDLEEKELKGQDGNTVTISTNHLSNYALVYSGDNNASDNNIDLSNFKNLPDGEYNLGFDIFNYTSPNKLSMSDGAVTKPAKLIVKNGEYRVEVTFSPLTFLNQHGYLGNLAYYDKDGVKKQGTILSYYSENEVDNFIGIYKKVFPDRTAYPKVITYPINKNDIDSEGKLKTRINVFVPVMASMGEEIGYQDALPTYYFNTLKLIKKYEKESNEGLVNLVDKNVSGNNEAGNYENNQVAASQKSPYRGGQLGKLTRTGINNSAYPLLAIFMLSGAYALRKKLK